MREKFSRTGAFVIDVMIAKMFTQVVLSVLLYLLALGSSTMLQFLKNEQMALPILLLMMVGMLLTFIAVYLGYCALCYRLIGKSLGKYLLSVTSGQYAQQQGMAAYLQREKEKITLLCATLGLYAAYAGAQYYAHNAEPWHEARSLTR